MNGGYLGGCQCGAVRFHAARLLDTAHVCYCRMCQKAVGNFFAALVGVADDALTWTRGTPSTFRSSEQVDRGFCRDCGTPLFYHNRDGAHVSLTIGAFDEPQRIVVRSQFCIEGRHPAVLHLGELAIVETAPEELLPIGASNRQHPDHDTAVWPAAELSR